MALPMNAGDMISLLGVICQANPRNDTSKACFWDNAAVPKGKVVPFEDFVGGADLEGGDGLQRLPCRPNVFVVHPDTPLDLGPILIPNAWHDPLVPAGWPQNPARAPSSTRWCSRAATARA